MARDSGMQPAWICSDPRLARAGIFAGLLYLQGRSKCDSYGRLPGDPEQLIASIVPQWAFKGHLTEDDVRVARDCLVAERLWHLYQVDGAEYIEYEGFDRDQQPSWLPKRGSPSYPDPPDRPELAVSARPHYKPKRQTEQTEPTIPPDRVPSQPVKSSRVPPREEQSPVSEDQEEHGAPIRQTPEYREFEQVCRDNELESWLREGPFIQLYQAVRSTGRDWQVLIEVAKEAALAAGGKPPAAAYGLTVIRNLPSELKSRTEVREHFAERREGGRNPPETDAPPNNDTEDPRERLRRERAAEAARWANASTD